MFTYQLYSITASAFTLRLSNVPSVSAASHFLVTAKGGCWESSLNFSVFVPLLTFTAVVDVALL